MSSEISLLKMKKKPSNKELNTLTREAICSAFILLLKELPYHKITVTDLVKKAGVSRTAYYNNYHEKQEILDDLVDSLIYEINDALVPYTDINTGKANPPEIFIRNLLELLYAKKEIYQTLYNAHFHFIILERLNDSMLSHFSNSNLEAIYRVYFNAGALYNVFSKWIVSCDNISIDDMTQICLNIYQTPMSTPSSSYQRNDFKS